MQLFVDYLPILVFFVTYVVSKNIYTAVVALMIIAPLVFAGQWLLTKSVNKISAASTALIVILGGVTLVFGNPLFFYWKPTILNWAIALVFLGSQFVGNKPIVRRMIEATTKDAEQSIVMSDGQWNKLNLMWISFFVLSGASNIYVAYNFSEPTWVNFKLFGLLGLTVVFVVIQSIWIANNVEADSPSKEESDI